MTSIRKLFRRNQDRALPNAQRPPHLTAEQMEAMLRNSPYRRQASKHLDACTSCREEVDKLSDLFGRFRMASTLLAQQEQTRCEVEAGSNGHYSRSAALRWRWSVAAGALACALGALPVLHFGSGSLSAPSHAARNVAPARSLQISDEALLDGVQQDLATSVAAPLQVLAANSSSASSSVISDGKPSATGGSSAVASQK